MNNIADKDNLTPMMKQYLTIKEECPDCLLFFRLGDFYELFFSDAQTAAKELELTLTGRDCGLKERAPMCGVPHHAVDGYINRLVQRGYKVAICDQVEDPAQAKGIVRRAITRVVTPGTVTDSLLLDEKANHYILAVYKVNQYYGLAACDLTTGVFEATELITGNTDNHLTAEIARYQPAEIIINNTFFADPLSDSLSNRYNVMMTLRDDNYFSLETARQKDLTPQDGHALWPQAAAAMISYLEETQRTGLSHLKPVQVYRLNTFMNLSPEARRNLEITKTLRDQHKRGSLLWSIDQTVTAVGGRLLRRWIEQPLLLPEDILQRQESVRVLKEGFMVRQELRDALDGLYDLERLSGKLAMSTANARDLIALKLTLQKLPHVITTLQALDEAWLIQLQRLIDPLPELFNLLDSAIQDEPPAVLKEGGLIKEGYNEDIDRNRDAAVHGRQWIIELEQTERERTGIKSLKVGFNRVFGYYIDVTRANLALVPDSYQRKQTLANSERYITTELKEMEDTILGAEQRLVALEYETFCSIREQATAYVLSLQQTADALATLDVLAALAELADRGNYCQPTIDLTSIIEIEAGRHPVIEKTLPAGQFVANDLLINDDARRLMILTGPNMSGKSTYLRQNALIVLLAQIGSFVPARSARIGIVDQIFTRIGASDDLAAGQSTFMVEMTELSHILHHATRRSLLILDEVGRGTGTYDGLSLAWSLIEYLADQAILGCRTLFATHYHELTGLARQISGVFNCHVTVREEDKTVVFLHQIKDGGSDESYGIEVARLANVPKAIVQRATELLLQLKSEQGTRQRTAIRRSARPMDGQLDLFSASQALRESEEIMAQLQALDVSQMTPLDALNLVYDLQRQALRGKGN